jgi:DNA-binding Lrp family transcriptional regulator
MELKPQDVLVTLKLLLTAGAKRPTYAQLAMSVGLSASEVHAAVRRAKAARLIHEVEGGLRVDRRAVLEFVIHGLKYAFPAERGGLTRGMPTSYAAPPMNRDFAPTHDPPPVWPGADGKVRGFEFKPLSRSAPKAAKLDGSLYEVLALIDALREGRARERLFAEKELTARIGTHPHK